MENESKSVDDNALSPEERQRVRAQRTLRLDANPDFQEYLKHLSESADDLRLDATNQDPEKPASRLQMLDMARGVDTLVINWEDSVAMAKEFLVETPPETP